MLLRGAWLLRGPADGKATHSSCPQKGSCVPSCGALQMLQSMAQQLLVTLICFIPWGNTSAVNVQPTQSFMRRGHVFR